MHLILVSQYRFPAWQVGIILGIVIGGGGGMGTLISGFIVRKLDLRPPGMAIHVIIVRCLYVICLVVMMFLTSDGVSDAEPKRGDEWWDVGKSEDAEDWYRQQGASGAEESTVTNVIDDTPEKRGQHHGNVVHGARVVRRGFGFNSDVINHKLFY